MIRKILMPTVALATMASAALAADSTGPAVNWTGYYAGAQIGYMSGSADWDVNKVNNGYHEYWRPHGGFGGLHAGYNYQVGTAVFGLQAEANLIDNRKWHTDFADEKLMASSSVFGSLDARMGATFERALVYAIGGIAFANNKTKGVTAIGPDQVLTATFSGNNVGWNIGLGVEYAVDDRWSVRAEYRYYDFGKKNFPNSEGDTYYYAHSHSYVDHTLRLGLSYKFGPPAAVVAKY